MVDIRNINIWKTDDNKEEKINMISETPIEELYLKVRSYNCLKRAGCHCVGDILKLLDNDEDGLKRIRNLGSVSEKEIKEAVRAYRENFKPAVKYDPNVKYLISPSTKSWNRTIDEYMLSESSYRELKSNGINLVGDLYKKSFTKGPSWTSVRELFGKIIGQ